MNVNAISIQMVFMKKIMLSSVTRRMTFYRYELIDAI